MIRWLLLCVVGTARCGDVPAFVWSGSALPDGAAYELDRVSANEIGATMTASSPKLAVLVVLPSGNAVEISSRQSGALASVMRDANASRMFAFVEAPAEMPKMVGNRFFEGSRHRVVDWTELGAEIDSAVGGVLVSVAPDFETFERSAQSLTSAAETRAADLGGSYSIGLAVASNNAVKTSRRRRRLDTTTTPDGVRMTPDILTGVLVGLLFIFTVWVGITCIGDIQTPSQYAHTGPPSLKEW